MGEITHSIPLFFNFKKEDLKEINRNFLNAFYENLRGDESENSPKSFIAELIHCIPEIIELKIIDNIITEIRKYPNDKRIEEKLRMRLKDSLYSEIDFHKIFYLIKKHIFIDGDELDKFCDRLSSIIYEHNITLSNQKSTQTEIIGEFIRLHKDDSLLCSELLAGLRKYCDVFLPSEYEFIKPSLDYCITNFDVRSDMFLEPNLVGDDLLEGISKKSIGELSYQESKKLASRLILAYERGMIGKFQGDFYKAQRIMETLLDVLKNNDEEIKILLSEFKIKGETIDHQLFTFSSPKVYVEFQINLLKSRLGQKGLKWDGNDDDGENISENMEKIIKATKELGYLHESIAQNSKDRVMIHIDTLMRRTHYENYEEWINTNGTNWKYELKAIKTNQKMMNFLKYRWDEQEDWNSRKVKRGYTNDMKELYNLILNKNESSAAKDLFNKIGDISINNPLFRHSTTSNFSYLSFIHPPGKISKDKQMSDMINLFYREKNYTSDSDSNTNHTIESNKLGELTNEVDQKNLSRMPSSRILITNHSMITNDIGKINRSNIYADCAFINSLKVEKLRRNSEPIDDTPLEDRLIIKSTGQLRKLSLNFENGYHRDIQVEIKKDEDSGKKRDLLGYALTNHFLNSYNWMPLFKKHKTPKRKVPTSTLKLNRINVMGKGIRELLDMISFQTSKKGKRFAEILPKRISQTIAENHPFAVISMGDVEAFEESPKKFIGYLSLFAINRLGELIKLLQDVQLLTRSSDLPGPYKAKVKRLVLKYSKLIECELHTIEALWLYGHINQYEKGDVKTQSKDLLRKFKDELEDYTNSRKHSKRLPKMYIKYLSELKQIDRLVDMIYPVDIENNKMKNEINLITQIQHLRKSCQCISSLIHEDKKSQEKDETGLNIELYRATDGDEGIHALIQKRTEILQQLGDSSSDISAYNIFYTSLLTARLITDYEKVINGNDF